MKLLFDKLSADVSKLTTQKYSTSFSFGIYFLEPRLRAAIYAIYGFVRVADEIVDSFEGFDKRELLMKFKTEAYHAIRNRISANPILNSFQWAVHQYNIDEELIETFLRSMEMDLEKVRYTREKYEEYILGSAEVVGLMCLHVFTEGDKTLYAELKPYAMRLGSAFQKVNFLRDMRDDYKLLGRQYFPGISIEEFTKYEKRQIENDIENDFQVALKGIRKLPASSRAGVYLAYCYYQTLLRKIKKLPPQRVLSERIRINNGKKLSVIINSLIDFKLKLG
jgi:phytoene synthase